jgi:Family of unknown function (DUF5989)
LSKLATLREFGSFLKTRKRYWLVPLLVMLIVFGALLIFAEGSAAAPFIYTLF